MVDERMMHILPSARHFWCSYAEPVIELDGAPILVGVDDKAVLRTLDLRSGESASRPLDLGLDAADPDLARCLEPRRPEIDKSNIAARVTATELDGRPVVITGGHRFDNLHDSGGIVRVWDLRTGDRVGTWMVGHELEVCSLTTVTSERGPLIVSSCEAGILLAWELTTNERVVEIEAGYNGVMAAASVNGRAVAVTGGDDDFVQVWDLLADEQIGGDLTGIEANVRAIAIAEREGRAVVLAAGDDNLLHAWDLDTQERVWAPIGLTVNVQALGTATVAGRAIAVTGCGVPGEEGDVVTDVWDLGRGERLGDPLSGHGLLSVTEIAGAPVAITTTADSSIVVWDLTVLAGR